MHIASEPSILYFGTPVVIISTENEDGSFNLAPMSSAFWLGWRCMLGLSAFSKTAQNLRRTGECVLNLPLAAQVDAVNRLALTTGANPVPPRKAGQGYRHVKDKFALAGFTPQASETVAPPRVVECPVQLEACIEASHGIAEEDDALRGRLLCFEARIKRVHLDEAILVEGKANHVDPDKWRPLIMSFQKFYGLDGGELQASTLATIPEAWYRSGDVERARRELVGAGGARAEI